jgi:hypothetical protein
VLHVHLREVIRWRNHRMWLLSFEALASLIWVVALVAALLVAALGIVLGASGSLFGFALAWGIAISFVALVQMVVALSLERGYDRTIIRPLLLGAAYPWGTGCSPLLPPYIPKQSHSCGGRAGGSCGTSRASGSKRENLHAFAGYFPSRRVATPRSGPLLST